MHPYPETACCKPRPALRDYSKTHAGTHTHTHTCVHTHTPACTPTGTHPCLPEAPSVAGRLLPGAHPEMQPIFRAIAGWCFSLSFRFLSFPEKIAAGANGAVSPVDDSDRGPDSLGYFLKSREYAACWHLYPLSFSPSVPLNWTTQVWVGEGQQAV